MNMRKNLNKKGFTLAELLIVVAIVAILVVIAIPVFKAQLEKARYATSLANIRSALAEAKVDMLTETIDYEDAIIIEDVAIPCSAETLQEHFQEICEKVGLEDFALNGPYDEDGDGKTNLAFWLDEDGIMAEYGDNAGL